MGRPLWDLNLNKSQNHNKIYNDATWYILYGRVNKENVYIKFGNGESNIAQYTFLCSNEDSRWTILFPETCRQIMEATPDNMAETTRNVLHNFSTEITTSRADIFMEKVETLITLQIPTFLKIYWFPMLVPIGLVGNTLSFLVMIKPKNRAISTCIHMAAISVNDNFMMLMATRNWLATELKIYKRNSVECKVTSFLVLLILQNSTFQILAMTVDKYIAIKWPHRAASYSTPKTAKATIAAVFICVVIYNVPHFFASKLIGLQCFGYRTGGVVTKVYS